MRKFLLVLAVMALICSPALAGKNQSGALVVHTDDTHTYTTVSMCAQFDIWYPGIVCSDLNTTTNKDEATKALIWVLAAFPPSAVPGVQVIYFGLNHNLPPGMGYIEDKGFCGPAGSFELPDAGWADYPATAGNSVAFGSPVVGDILFPFYYFTCYGFSGAYFGTGINPVGGYASFEDDSNPPQTDYITRFGTVRWYVAGENNCPPSGPMPGACCFTDGSCQMADDAAACEALGGLFEGAGTTCTPNPCPQPGACCFDDGRCEYLLEDLCTGSLWIGGVDCDPNPCPQPPEACCFDTGACTFVPPDQCGGTPWGPGTDCDPNPCPQPPEGACCDEATGACYVSTEVNCGEELWIEGEVCDPNPCPQPPVGACCYGCQECIVLTQIDCEALADDYAWYTGEVCDPNPCPPVATETTTWGTIKADYK